MHRRFDAGPLLAAAGAALLAVSLFLSWYEPDLNAWQVFEALDLVLAALAVGIIVLAFRPRPDGRLLVALAAAAFLIVVVQLIEPPPAAAASDLELGSWLALAGSALALLGAILVLAAISVHVDVRGREHRRREAAVDRRTRTGGEGETERATARRAGAAERRAAREDAVAGGSGTAAAGGAEGGSVSLDDTEEAAGPSGRSLFARRDPDATQTFAPVEGDEDDTGPAR